MSKAKRKQWKTLTVLNEETGEMDAYRVEFTNAEKPLPIPVSFTEESLTSSKRGSTWQCILANEITRYAKAHPEDFPDGFVLPHVERRAVYIITKRQHRKRLPAHPVAVRYMVDVGKIIDAFDEQGCYALPNSGRPFGGRDDAVIASGEKRGGEEKPHARETRARKATPARIVTSKGAWRRARNAGFQCCCVLV